MKKKNIRKFINLKSGVKFACFGFIIFGMLFLPNTLLYRPHPAFWRIILAMTLIYMVFLSFANLLVIKNFCYKNIFFASKK